MCALWKNYSESYKRSFLIILCYGISFGLGYITKLGNPTFSLWFYISEQNKYVLYQFKLKDVLDLIFIGPIFTILSFVLIKRILDDLKEQQLADKKVMFFWIIYLIAIVVYNYGNMIHVTMNRLNAQIIEDYNTQDLYYFVYFLDEVVGHLFLTIGFFIVFTETSYLHTISLQKHTKSEELTNFLMNNNERNWNFLFGIGLGAFTAFAYLEGQCAFVFLLLNPIFCGLLILYNNKWTSIKLKDNSMMIMYLLMTIAFAITIIIWGLVTGFKPVYPFFYQNSEL